MTTSKNKIRFGLVIVMSMAGLALPAVAVAGHGKVVILISHQPKGPPHGKPTMPPTTGNGDGETTIVGKPGHEQKGFDPLALTPIGTPGTPLAEQSAWDKFENTVLTALAKVDTAAGDHLAETQAVRAAMQERDVRTASKNTPKRTVAVAK